MGIPTADELVLSSLTEEHAAEAPASAGTGRATLASRVGELLVVGGVTLLLYPLSHLLRGTLGLDAAELAVGFTMFHAAHVLNDPHFSVTYLLFYEDARARAFGAAFPAGLRVRWWLAGVVVPAVLGTYCAVALALESAVALGLLFELMLLLVGWHYVKQGFGVLVVLSARRGIRYTPWERRAILAHCFAGWAYAWASPAGPGREVSGKGVYYTSLAHPAWLESLTLGLFAASAVGLVLALGWKTRREGRLPLVTPLVGLLVSIWAWSVWSSADPLVRYAVPALHSVQYLYFVWLRKGGEYREGEAAPHFGRPARTRLAALFLAAVALGWVLFDGAPMLLDGALVTEADALSDLGPTPYFAAIYAFVNLHHYFMDNVVWRRENPGNRHLAARPVEAAAVETVDPGPEAAGVA